MREGEREIWSETETEREKERETHTQRKTESNRISTITIHSSRHHYKPALNNVNTSTTKQTINNRTSE